MSAAGSLPSAAVRAVTATGSGLALAACFEPYVLPYLLPAALAGFALSVRGLRARTAWVPGLLFGAAFYLTHIHWMSASIGPPAWLALSATETAFYAVLGALAPALLRLRLGPLWLAAAWTVMETTRSTQPFSGMPWGRLAFAVVDTPVAPALSWVGMSGLSFLLALLGFCLAELVVALAASSSTTSSTRHRLLVGGATVGLGALLCVPALAPARPPTTGEVTVAMVQGGVPGRGDDVLFDPEGLTANHVAATLDLADDVDAGRVPAPDFVVWPENSTAVDPFRPGPVGSGIEEAVQAVDVPVVVGALVDDGPDHVLNEGIVWDPETGPGETYAKQNPVTYGEYIPFRGLLPDAWLESGQLARIPRDMVAGQRETPLEVAGVPVADAICFDVAYDGGFRDQLENGAELLMVQTSNASFIFTDQVDQQFAMTRLRAIESGRWVVVATTNGISGVIAPDGEVVATAPTLDPAVLVEQVGLVDGVTPGTRLSPWFAALTGAGAAGATAWSLLAYRRRRREAAAGDGPDDHVDHDDQDD